MRIYCTFWTNGALAQQALICSPNLLQGFSRGLVGPTWCNNHYVTTLWCNMIRPNYSQNGLMSHWQVCGKFSLTTQNPEIYRDLQNDEKFCVWGKTFTEAKQTLTKGPCTKMVTLYHCLNWATCTHLFTMNLQMTPLWLDFLCCDDQALHQFHLIEHNANMLGSKFGPFLIKLIKLKRIVDDSFFYSTIQYWWILRMHICGTMFHIFCGQ